MPSTENTLNKRILIFFSKVLQNYAREKREEKAPAKAGKIIVVPILYGYRDEALRLESSGVTCRCLTDIFLGA